MVDITKLTGAEISKLPISDSLRQDDESSRDPDPEHESEEDETWLSYLGTAPNGAAVYLETGYDDRFVGTGYYAHVIYVREVEGVLSRYSWGREF